MGLLDTLWHLLNFFAPAIGVGAIASVLAKLFWRADLAAVPLARLFKASAGAGAVMLLISLVLFGRDGTMAGYGLLVLACAAALWWAGFVRRARSG